MAVDLTPKSHVDTPAWQSFEMRMRARAAERRRAKRQRRLRRLTFAGTGLFALALGVGSAVAFKAMDGRGVIDRALSARDPIEEAVARQPIVIDWPPPPDPPETLTGAPIGALPLPADWSGSGNTTADAGTKLAPEPAPATEAAAAEAPSTSLSRGETPDDVMFPDQKIQGRTPPAATASTSPATERRGEPSVTVPTPGSTRAANRVSEIQSGVNRQTALNDSTSARRTAATTDRPKDRVEPAPALANQPDATGSAAIRPPATGEPPIRNLANLPAEPPVGTPPPEPSVGTPRRNPVTEPSVGTNGRNLPSEPPVGTSSSEPSVGTPRRNPSAEPTVGTRSAEPSVGTPRRNPPSEPTAGTQDPRASVRAVLDRYRSAYRRLDAAAARAVWPAVDAGALARAFGSLSSQEVSFDACSIDVADRTADATCKGQSRVVPKIGGGIETARRTWNFKLRQAGSDWVIEKATVK